MVKDFEEGTRIIKKALDDLENSRDISDPENTKLSVNEVSKCARSNQNIVQDDLSKENLEAALKESEEKIVPR
jgi:hypothetical protein